MQNNRPVSGMRNGVLLIVILLIVLLGGGSLARLEMKTLPDQGAPVYTIRAAASGLPAEMVAEQVTLPLEEAVRELGPVEKITSRTQAGLAVITVRSLEKPGSDYADRLEEQIAETARNLPGGAESVTVEQEMTGDNQLGYLLLHGTDLQSLSNVARYTVMEKLANLPGISRVEIDDSSVENKVEVLLRPSMLQTYGLTPGDVLGQLRGTDYTQQVGTAGEGADSTSIHWISQTESAQELGRKLIASPQGYVALSMLADIRDLRGSLGDAVPLYKGEPAIGIRLYAQETAQIPEVLAMAEAAVWELNEDAKGRYVLDWFAQSAAVLKYALRDALIIAGIATLVAAVYVGWRMRSAAAACMLPLTAGLTVLTLLAGLWLTGNTLNLATMGPALILLLLANGVGIALLERMAGLDHREAGAVFRISRQLLAPVLLGMLILFALYVGILFTDVVKSSDKPALYDGLPVFLLGFLVLPLVYGFIMPGLAVRWLTGRTRASAEGKGKRISAYLFVRWERGVSLGYIPYGITLICSLLTLLFLHTFVLVDPFLKTNPEEMTLQLHMVKGSSLEEAMRAAKAAEEKLRSLPELKDMYAVASEKELQFHLRLQDKFSWTKSRTKLEEELDKMLRGIPQTDPFALVVGEERATRLEFAVKGPSLQTSREIANQMYDFLRGLSWRDEDGQEIITDERLGTDDGRLHIEIKARPEMLARYQISEAEVKSQLQSYLGEQSAGSVYWNDASVPIIVRMPERLLEHADQVRNLLIDTAKGRVRLADLVEWRVGDAPATYEREDGLYVFKVSSAVSEPNRIDGLYYFLPERMERTVTIPAGYEILTGDDLEKAEEEENEKADHTGRVFVGGLAVVITLLSSMVLRRNLYDGLITLVLLPVLAGGVLLGLLVLNRPLNVLGFYGALAAAAMLIQQALLLLDHLGRWPVQPGETAALRIQAAMKPYFPYLLTVCGSVLLAILPLAAGWGSGIDVHASFAASLFGGMLLATWAVAVLLPGMVRTRLLALEKRDLEQQPLREQLRIWWENYQIKRKDLRAWKEQEKRRGSETAQDGLPQPSSKPKEPSPEDFTPLSPS